MKHRDFIIDYFFVFTFIFVFELLLGVWNGYPVGYDAYNHLTRLKFIVDNFPHINWAPFWSAGTPIFLWYPPLPYIISAAIIFLTNWTPEFTLNMITIFSICISGVLLYCLIFEVTRDRQASIASSLIAITTPSFLYWHIVMGLYDRITATPFLFLTIWSSLIYVKKLNEGESDFKFLILSVISISLVVQFQMLIGLFGGIQTMLVLLLMTKNIKKNIFKVILIPLWGCAISLYYFLPFLYSTPGSKFFSSSLQITAPPFGFMPLIYPQMKGVVYGLSPFIIPLLSFYIVLSILKRRYPETRQIITFCLIPLALITYVLIAYFHIPKDYNAAFLPRDLTFFIPLFLAPLLGVFWASTLKNFKYKKHYFILFFCIFSLWLPFQYTSLRFSNPRVHGDNYQEPFITEMIQNETDLNFRFGVGQSEVAVWFNYKYNIHQTRDYFAQGVLNLDFRYFFDIGVWQRDDVNQANFLLDWWGVKWFVADSRFDQVTKFFGDPQYFQVHGSNEDDYFHGFKYTGASPILSASNSPVALFIGSDEAYGIFFQTLSIYNYNSQSLILINGGEYLDDLDTPLSKDFDLVIMYGYDYHYQENAYPFLAKYVEEGGQVLWLTDLSKDSSRDFLPEPSPIWSTEAKAFGHEWDFAFPRTRYWEDVDFSSFSPAIYAGGAWGYSGTTNADLKTNAEVIMSNHGEPIVVQRNFGKGNVIWCGLNLPLHAVSYANYEESRFFVRLVEKMIGKPRSEDPSYLTKQVNSEVFEIEVFGPAKGVLFKACYFPNWKAYNGHSRTTLDIHKAGPGFMYVVIPESEEPMKIQFRYVTSNVEMMGSLISLFSLILLFLGRPLSIFLGKNLN